MRPLAKLGIGCAAALALASVGAVLVAPLVWREASQVVGPMREMKRRQTALDDMVDELDWRRPERDALTSEQLDRFFEIRKRVERARRQADPSLDSLPRKNVRSLEELREVPSIIRGVTDIVGAELDAYVAVRMPPAEYHWIERLVYERWRGELRKAGSYPAALRAAAAEIRAAAAREADGRVKGRLERLAGELEGRKPEPPEGIATELHELLLSRLDDVERHSMDDVVTPSVPISAR
jgi:hypothetical protein